ncbi:MAG: transporter [Solirubrobacterales bacterium]|nr:transporter [Solirubrobacterales bacterium]
MSEWLLRVLDGPAAGNVISLEHEVRVGRAASSDGRLGEDPELSREHARFSCDADGFAVLEDLGSTNGTFVNGELVESAQILHAGDRINLGNTTLQLDAPATQGADRTVLRDSLPAAGGEETGRPDRPAARPPQDEPSGRTGPESLSVLRGPAHGATIAVEGGIEFGREAAGSGALTGDPELSRRHARITRTADGALLLEDLGSTNGTYLNGWRIPSPQALADGDQIEVGQTLLELSGVARSAAREASIVGSGQKRVSAQPSSEKTVLRAEGVTKQYGDRPVLTGVDLEIRAGEIVGLLGPNGAGKTTFASIVAGLLPATSGRVTINEIDVRQRPRLARRQLGIAPQDLGIYPTQTVRRNLQFFGEISGLRGRLLRSRVDEIGEALSLTPLFERKAAILSGGQKRRLHAGMAMLHHPAMLILDEPTVGADIRTRQEILDTVRRLADEGRAVCYSTHYLPEIEALGAAVAILDAGRIVASGSIAELIARHSSPAVELTFAGEAPATDLGVRGEITREGSTIRIATDDPAATAAAVVARLGAHAARLRSVEIVSPSLDSVYLTLTERRYASGGSLPDADVSALPPPMGVPAGWYPDPAGRDALRFWDGQSWTDRIASRAA